MSDGKNQTESARCQGHSALTADTILPTIGDAALGIMTVGAHSAALDTQESKTVDQRVDGQQLGKYFPF